MRQCEYTFYHNTPYHPTNSSENCQPGDKSVRLGQRPPRSRTAAATRSHAPEPPLLLALETAARWASDWDLPVPYPSTPLSKRIVASQPDEVFFAEPPVGRPSLFAIGITLLLPPRMKIRCESILLEVLVL